MKFANAVDTEKAEFEVVKAGVALNIAKVTFADDKKSAVLEMSAKLTNGEYTVNVTGVSEKTLSETVQVTDEIVASIEILSDIAVLSSNDVTDPTRYATVAYQVKNQYGEDITKTTSLTTNDLTTVSANPTTGVVNIVVGTNGKVGDKVAVALIHAESAKSATQVVTLSSASAVTEVAFDKIYNKDGKELNEDSNFITDKFYVLVDLKNQYGDIITDATIAENGLVKAQSNPTVVTTAGTDPAVTLSPLTIDGDKRLGIELSGTPKAGENQVTLISNTSGKNDAFKIVVAETTRTDAVSVSAPALAVAKEEVLVPATVLDKDGKAITDTKVLNHADKGVKVTYNGNSLTGSFILKDGSTFVKLDAIPLQTEGIYALVLQSSTYKVATTTINVRKAAEATVIRGLKSTVSPTMLISDTKTIDAKDLVVEDQYGRAMDSAVVKAALTGSQKILIKPIAATPSTVTIGSAGDEITSSTVIGLDSGITNGTEKFQFVLVNAAGNEVLSSATEVTFRVTDGTEYKSYEVAEIGTVYDAGAAPHADYVKDLGVYGVLSDGSKVALDSSLYTVKSSLTSLGTDASDGDINQAHTIAYATDENTKEETLTVTIGATGQEFVQTVTFSKVKPKVTSVAFVDDNDVDADEVDYIALTTGAGFTVADLASATTNDYNIVVTDQYGASVLATNTGATAFNDTTAVNAPTLTIVPVKGSMTITSNGLAGAAITSTLVSGNEFTVKVTYAGGVSGTINVVVQ